jgi:hypothetical protein
MFGIRERPVRLPTLEPKREMKRGLQRLGGLLMLGIGLVLIVDATHYFIVEREYRPLQKAVAVVWLVCLVPVQFGWQLLSNPRDAYGSLIGSTTWRICGWMISIGVILVAVLQLKSGDNLSGRLLEALAFAGVCFAKAQVTTRPNEITSS